MNDSNIKQLYRKDGSGRDAALAAYPIVIKENNGQEKLLNELAFIAADLSHPEALRLMFDAGVSPSVIGKYGYTLLHYQAIRDWSKYHVLPEGAMKETVSLLLDNKVSALRKDENRGMTCYHYAAQNALTEAVEALAARGVKLNVTDKDGNTGIHIACRYVEHALKDVGYKKKSMENFEKQREDRLISCKERGLTEEETTNYMKGLNSNLEDAKRDMEAAERLVEEYFRTVKAFAEGGVDIDEKNAVGKTALDIAVEKNAKKIAAYLSGTLTEGDDSAVVAGGMTLHQAAEKGDAAAIRALAEKGAEVNGLKDDDRHKFGGCTPLAIATAFLHADAAEALLKCGADPSFKDGYGNTALYYLFSPNLDKAYINETIIAEKRIPRILKAMMSAGLSVNQIVDESGDTLLNLACRSVRGTMYKNHTIKGDVIEEVMRNNPDLNLPNLRGGTPLMHACAHDFGIMENVQLALLEQGANVSAADMNGDTALHYAARNRDGPGAKTLCDMLLEFGADAKAVNNAKQTALDIAAGEDNEPLVKLLLSKM
jgi:ankyrin repeat protein